MPESKRDALTEVQPVELLEGSTFEGSHPGGLQQAPGGEGAFTPAHDAVVPGV